MEIKQYKPFLIPTYHPDEILGEGYNKVKPASLPNGKGQITNYKFPADKKKEFLNLIIIGLSATEAAISLKLPVLDVKALIKMNKDGIKGEIAQALMHRKIIHLNRLTKAEKGWQASAYYLERRYPQEFGKESTVNVVNEQRQTMLIAGKEIVF